MISLDGVTESEAKLRNALQANKRNAEGEVEVEVEEEEEEKEEEEDEEEEQKENKDLDKKDQSSDKKNQLNKHSPAFGADTNSSIGSNSTAIRSFYSLRTAIDEKFIPKSIANLRIAANIIFLLLLALASNISFYSFLAPFFSSLFCYPHSTL